MLSRVSCNKCLAGEQYRACSSLSRKRLVTRKPAVRARGGDFSAIRMRKNTTPWPIAWTGYVRPATINQAMGGRIVFSCSDPIPPVAVATIQPAEHVLSRSAGSKASSSFTIDIIGHHPPYEAGKLSGNCSYSHISFFSMVDQLVVFSAKPNICLVGIGYDFSSVS